MYCTQCGNEMLNSAMFCSVCGTRASTNEESENESVTSKVVDNDATVGEESSIIKEDVELNVENDRGNVPALICPKCSSNSVTNVEVVYLQNVKSSSTGPIIGASISGDSVGGMFASIGWDTQTGLAKKIAPPKRPGLGGGLEIILIWIGLTFVIGCVFFVLAIFEHADSDEGRTFALAMMLSPIISIVFLFIVGIINTLQLPKYKHALAKWMKQFICPVCGTIFTT
jgi:hypothetical protein